MIRITGRPLRAVAVPQGPDVVGLLADLKEALAGQGPALLPHTPGKAPDPRLGPGLPLGPDEDDPTDPTVAVVSTSGSTGAPRGALLHASALLGSVSACHDRLGGPGRWLLALPAHHVAGFAVLVRSLVSGTVPVAQDLSSGFTAEGFEQAARQMRGPRRYTSLVPTQLTRLLAAGPRTTQVLAGFDAVLLGGASASPALLHEARERGIRVVTTYGMSETCGGCVYDGRPLDGVRISLTEPDAEAPRSPGDADGERIWLGGPVVARGYRTVRTAAPGGTEPGGTGPGGALPEGLQENVTRDQKAADPDPGTAFQRSADGTRWLRTSDLGRWTRTGAGEVLEILGRLDDMIITGGLKVAPSVVEAAVLDDPGIAQAVAFGVPDPQWGQRVVVAVVPAVGSGRPDPTRIRQLGSRAGRAAAPRQVLVLDDLPLRGPGKPDRTALRHLALRAPVSPDDQAPDVERPTTP